jgi:hypothetical protein
VDEEAALDPSRWDAATVERRLTEVLQRLPSREAIVELAHLGWRTEAVVEALEALARDESLPLGGAAALVGDGVTREVALFVRVGLGVEPRHVAGVRTLSAQLPDPIARDVVLAFVPGEADAVVERLVEHASAASAVQIETLVAIALGHAASRATTRRGRLAPMRLPTRRPPMRLRRRQEAHLRAWNLAPGDLPPELVGLVARRPRFVSLANVAPPAKPHSHVRRPSSPERDPASYRAMRAGGPTITTALLMPILAWPTAARLAALDGLADADALSDDAVAFLEGCLADPGPTAEAALHALVTHTPGGVLTHVAALAADTASGSRARAASLLGAMPDLGPDALALLDVLEVDGSPFVRRAARRARATRSHAHDARLWLRRVLWCVLRDDDAASLVFASLMDPARTPLPALPGPVLRRAQRALRDVELSHRAREWLAAALHRPAWAGGEATVLASPNATLTSTDGRSLAIAVEMATGDTITDVLATIVSTSDLRGALPSEVSAFVRTAPSSYMRFVDPSGVDVAVRAFVRDGGVVLVATDPRVLDRLRGA